MSHGQRIGDEVGDRETGEPERLAREAVRTGRARGRDDGSHAGIGSRRQDRPDPAHRVTGDRPDRHLGLLDERAEGRQRVGAELTGGERQGLGWVGAVSPDVEGQAMEPGGVEEDAPSAGSDRAPIPSRGRGRRRDPARRRGRG